MPGSAIQAAVDAAGPNARFCIASGIHRLQSVIPKDGQSFIGETGSVLNGSEILTRFVRVGDQWVSSARQAVGSEHGQCVVARPACSRPAGLFLAGKSLAQTTHRAELRADQFYFDRSTSTVVLGQDPGDRLVEWSVTQNAFTGPAKDVFVAGVVIEKYTNPAQQGAIWPVGRGWTLRNLEVRLNNGVGLVVSDDGTIKDCDIHHNGQLGIGGGQVSNVVISGNRVWANNTNGFDYDWEAGGVKVAASRHVVLRGNHVYDNEGPGLWCDESCRDVLIENNFVERNSSAGIFYEISFDAVIRGNRLQENGQAGLPWVWGAEIQVAASEHVTVTGNIVTVRPGGKAILLIDQNRPRFGGGLHATRNNQVMGNQVTFLGNGLSGGASDARPTDQNFAIIQSGGNIFEGNVYHANDTALIGFLWGGQDGSFREFQRHGQEQTGRLAGPRSQ